MEEGKKDLFYAIVNLIKATNSLMEAVLNEDEKDISYWIKSIKNWQKNIDKKAKRYLKRIKEKNIF